MAMTSVAGCGTPNCTNIAQRPRQFPVYGARTGGLRRLNARTSLILKDIHCWHADCFYMPREHQTARHTVIRDGRRSRVRGVWSRETKGSSFKLDLPGPRHCSRPLARRETAATLSNVCRMSGYLVFRFSGKPVSHSPGDGSGPGILPANDRGARGDREVPAYRRIVRRAQKCRLTGRTPGQSERPVTLAWERKASCEMRLLRPQGIQPAVTRARRALPARAVGAGHFSMRCSSSDPSRIR